MFALPLLRELLAAPFGSYVDFLGFSWCMLILAVSSALLYTAMHAGYHHGEDLYVYDEEDEGVQDVEFTGEGRDALAESLACALGEAAGLGAGGNAVAAKGDRSAVQ
jgi:hypothetical protein